MNHGSSIVRSVARTWTAILVDDREEEINMSRTGEVKQVISRPSAAERSALDGLEKRLAPVVGKAIIFIHGEVTRADVQRFAATCRELAGRKETVAQYGQRVAAMTPKALEAEYKRVSQAHDILFAQMPGNAGKVLWQEMRLQKLYELIMPRWDLLYPLHTKAEAAAWKKDRPGETPPPWLWKYF